MNYSDNSRSVNKFVCNSFDQWDISLSVNHLMLLLVQITIQIQEFLPLKADIDRLTLGSYGSLKDALGHR